MDANGNTHANNTQNSNTEDLLFADLLTTPASPPFPHIADDARSTTSANTPNFPNSSTNLQANIINSTSLPPLHQQQEPGNTANHHADDDGFGDFNDPFDDDEFSEFASAPPDTSQQQETKQPNSNNARPSIAVETNTFDLLGDIQSTANAEEAEQPPVEQQNDETTEDAEDAADDFMDFISTIKPKPTIDEYMRACIKGDGITSVSKRGKKKMAEIAKSSPASAKEAPPLLTDIPSSLSSRHKPSRELPAELNQLVIEKINQEDFGEGFDDFQEADTVENDAVDRDEEDENEAEPASDFEHEDRGNENGNVQTNKDMLDIPMDAFVSEATAASHEYEQKQAEREAAEKAKEAAKKRASAAFDPFGDANEETVQAPAADPIFDLFGPQVVPSTNSNHHAPAADAMDMEDDDEWGDFDEPQVANKEETKKHAVVEKTSNAEEADDDFFDAPFDDEPVVNEKKKKKEEKKKRKKEKKKNKEKHAVAVSEDNILDLNEKDFAPAQKQEAPPKKPETKPMESTDIGFPDEDEWGFPEEEEPTPSKSKPKATKTSHVTTSTKKEKKEKTQKVPVTKANAVQHEEEFHGFDDWEDEEAAKPPKEEEVTVEKTKRDKSRKKKEEKKAKKEKQRAKKKQAAAAENYNDIFGDLVASIPASSHIDHDHSLSHKKAPDINAMISVENIDADDDEDWGDFDEPPSDKVGSNSNIKSVVANEEDNDINEEEEDWADFEEAEPDETANSPQRNNTLAPHRDRGRSPSASKKSISKSFPLELEEEEVAKEREMNSMKRNKSMPSTDREESLSDLNHFGVEHASHGRLDLLEDEEEGEDDEELPGIEEETPKKRRKKRRSDEELDDDDDDDDNVSLSGSPGGVPEKTPSLGLNDEEEEEKKKEEELNPFENPFAVLIDGPANNDGNEEDDEDGDERGEDEEHANGAGEVNPFENPFGDVDDDEDEEEEVAVQHVERRKDEQSTTDTVTKEFVMEEAEIIEAIENEQYEKAVLLYDIQQVQKRLHENKRDTEILQREIATSNEEDEEEEEDDDEEDEEDDTKRTKKQENLQKLIELEKERKKLKRELKDTERELKRCHANAIRLKSYSELVEISREHGKLGEFEELFSDKFSDQLPSSHANKQYVVDEQLRTALGAVIELQRRAHFFVDCISENSINIQLKLFKQLLEIAQQKFDASNEQMTKLMQNLAMFEGEQDGFFSHNKNNAQLFELLMEKLDHLLILFQICQSIGNGLHLIKSAFTENEVIQRCLQLWRVIDNVFRRLIVESRNELVGHHAHAHSTHTEHKRKYQEWQISKDTQLLPDKEQISQILMHMSQI